MTFGEWENYAWLSTGSRSKDFRPHKGELPLFLVVTKRKTVTGNLRSIRSLLDALFNMLMILSLRPDLDGWPHSESNIYPLTLSWHNIKGILVIFTILKFNLLTCHRKASRGFLLQASSLMNLRMGSLQMDVTHTEYTMCSCYHPELSAMVIHSLVFWHLPSPFILKLWILWRNSQVCCYSCIRLHVHGKSAFLRFSAPNRAILHNSMLPRLSRIPR